ncbi:MAG: orotidine-5'-phosphate decarboxylase [Pseudohongiellaceae bacterium]
MNTPARVAGADPAIIVALDFNEPATTLRLLEQLDPTACRVKVGKQLFTACGPALVEKIVGKGFDVFLDLKFHDIPNTVAGAVRAATGLGVWMLNVHASGGLAMLQAAREAAYAATHTTTGAETHAETHTATRNRPLLVGVTVLTSLGAAELTALGVSDSPEAQVLRLATLCQQAGLDGVVCSAAETPALRAAMPQDFRLVTPGIRRPEDASDDQQRILSPAEAIANGSNYLVVGRPITRADSPAAALAAFNTAISGAA